MSKLKMALKLLIKQKKEDEAKTNALKAIADLKKIDNPELQQQLKELLKDPAFLDGVAAPPPKK